MKNDKINLIKHVALIMDGNRRWAGAKKLPAFAGHRKGTQRIEPIIDKAIEMNIPYLTFWAFSTENWYRSKTEVSFLLNLYRGELNRKMDSFHKKKVKINVIGNIKMFPEDIQKKTKEWMGKTKDNKNITVNFALSYGGRDEILRAINKMRANSKLQNSNFKWNAEVFEQYLDTAGQRDPDLIIRTGGVQRLSGFLLWQSEYAELYFSDLYWPDFTPREFQKAVEEYYHRQRRFGR